MMSSHLMGAIFWVLVPNVSVNILHLEWILACFHYFSPKHHAIPPCTMYQFLAAGNTSQLCAINTHYQMLLTFVPTLCLHLGYVFNKPHGTSHTLLEHGLTSYCHLVEPLVLNTLLARLCNSHWNHKGLWQAGMRVCQATVQNRLESLGSISLSCEENYLNMPVFF